MSEKIIIIGGGISGLAAGIYAQKMGYESFIYEKNPNAGGLCTSWKRKGYKIDGCIHWLTGTRKDTSLYKLWQEVGAFKDEEIINLPTWGSIDYEGTTVTFYADLEKAEEEWIKISPVDKKHIKHFFKMVKAIRKIDLPMEAPAILLPLKTLFPFVISLLKAHYHYFRGMFISCEKYAKRFKSPALRWALTHIQPGAGNLYSMMFSYSTIAGKNGGIPIGGSDVLVNNMVNKYLSLGGIIHFNSEVVSIEKSKHKATGIKLQNGTIVKGDYFIACCDSNYVLINLLNNKCVYPKIAERYNKPHLHPAPSAVLINYLVPEDIKLNIPYCFKCEPYLIGNKENDYINIRSFAYDKTFSKNGKTILQVLIDQDSNDYDYWYDLYQDKEKYRTFKDEFAKKIAKIIEEQVKPLSGKIECLDVATPITFSRYVNASRGTYMSFLFNHRKMTIAAKGRLSGIDNFYLSGQYVQTPGGLPLALAAGKFSVQWIEHHKLHFFLKIFNLFKS